MACKPLRVTAAATIDGAPPRSRPLRPYAWSTVGIVAGITAIAHLVVATRYGWPRGELYYAEAGRHLALGTLTSRR